MLRLMDEGKSLREAFGRLLRELREARGLSQSELALESDLDQTFVSLLERGRRQPSLLSLFALCEALDIEPYVVVRRLQLALTPAAKRG
ncbi:MAG TPA: helix-turn-helix transcriptional regulator [Gammaproteobacteria bacterium]|jgi:transcriptional regulator with XRE-family HTH domain